MKRIKIITAFLALVSFSATAQQDAQYTQYMYNTVNINPAYAGSRGSLNIFGLYRSQWVGMDGAPNTGAFSVHTPLMDSKLGVGVSFLNDRIGIMNENTISIDFAYAINLGRRNTHRLAFGVKGSANLLSVDYTKLNKHNPNDQNLADNVRNLFTPNFGTGIYYHSDKMYVGFSIPNLLSNERYDENLRSTLSQELHYYLIGGYVFDLNPVLKFKPAFLLRAVKGAPFQVDLSGNFLIHDKFTIGGAYRWGAAWSAMIGFQITDGFFIGYSYDNDTRALASYNSGSHEVFMRYELFYRYKRVNSPRFF